MEALNGPSVSAGGSVGASSEGGGSGAAEISIIKAVANEGKSLRINKWRVRENQRVNSSKVILSYDVLNDKGEEVGKVTQKANLNGIVKRFLQKDGAVIQPGTPILEMTQCAHSTVIRDLCADCGADLRQNENGNVSEASVPMVHSIPDLKVSQQVAQKLGHADTLRLLEDRKLVLLVDLDQTLIHTTNDNVPINIKGIHHFQLYGPHSPWYHTRLRPGTREFLEKMSQLYELHICTFGARNYAHMIATILDPQGKFFSHRILSRDECFNATSKTDNLKALFPNGDSMVCIIDDREDVWNMASNLIQVKPYHFFQHTGDINAPPGMSKHELDGEGVDFDHLEKDAEKSSKEKKKAKGDLESKDKKDGTTGDDEEMPSTSQPMEKDKNTEEANEYAEVDDTVSSTTEISTKEEEKKSEVEEASKETSEEEPSSSTQAKRRKSNDSIPEKPASPKIKKPDYPGKEIEIEDPDDYLIYLEVILKKIHKRFYEIYDETKAIPDLKVIVPKIRSEVLRGKSLVFSGLVPTNMDLTQSRAYFIAQSLGADVTPHITPETTHVVAVTAGTFKVNTGRENPRIHVVNANWLWCCAERWEHVDERVFPLDRSLPSKSRNPPDHCHSPKHVVNYMYTSEISPSSSAQHLSAQCPEKFIDTINPLLAFSNDDLVDMNRDYDQFFESESDSEDDDKMPNIEASSDGKALNRKHDIVVEDRTREFFSRPSATSSTTTSSSKVANNEEANSTSTSDAEDDDDDEPRHKKRKINDEEDEDEDDETPSQAFRRGADLPSDLDVGSGSDSDDDSNGNPDSGDDGEWNMMGAALEREFLGLEDD